MATTLATFLTGFRDAMQEYTAADAATPLFGSVVVSPFVGDGALPAALRTRKFPLAVVSDGGGVRNRSNLTLDQRDLAVTIIVMGGRDEFGEKALLDLLGIVDRMETLVAQTTGGAVWLSADSDVQAAVTEDQMYYITKELTFSTYLERA